MIEKYCAYCKHINCLPNVKPCSICVARFGDVKPNFELDPVEYFKKKMRALGDKYNLTVHFSDDRHAKFILPHSIYYVCINTKWTESRLEAHIESIETCIKKQLSEKKDHLPRAYNSFGIRHAMYESSFGQVTRTYADNRTIPKIKDVKFNGPATIVFWEDGTKTVVKCQEGDTFDPEKGLAMAIAKKALGNENGYYSENIGKWVEKFQKEQVKNYFAELDEFGKRFARDFYNKLKLRGVDD